VTSLSTTTDPNVAVLTTYTGKGDPGYIHTCRMSRYPCMTQNRREV
jgi:hypothetical protein